MLSTFIHPCQTWKSCINAAEDQALCVLQVLARSLRLVGACHPLIVLHTKGSLPSDILGTLRCEGCYLHKVEPYTPPAHRECQNIIAAAASMHPLQ